jgi:hypothetical protein
MPEMIGSVVLRRYLNLTNRRLVFTNFWGRTICVEAGRGLEAAPCEELAALIARGQVEQVVEPRGGYEGPLPRSTDRRIPF